jgi:hypothetical protein
MMTDTTTTLRSMTEDRDVRLDDIETKTQV